MKGLISLIRDIKDSAKETLVFHSFNRYRRSRRPLEWNEVILTTWADASRVHQLGGYVLGFAPPDILLGKESPVTIVDWQSYKYRCTGNDTSGFEEQARYIGESAACQMRLLWATLHGMQVKDREQEPVASLTQSILVGDSQCVAVRNKESFGIGLARTWASGDLSLTDGLIRDTAESRKALALWHARRTWIIQLDEGFGSARKRLKVQRLGLEPAADECTFLDFED